MGSTLLAKHNNVDRVSNISAGCRCVNPGLRLDLSACGDAVTLVEFACSGYCWTGLYVGQGGE